MSTTQTPVMFTLLTPSLSSSAMATMESSGSGSSSSSPAGIIVGCVIVIIIICVVGIIVIVIVMWYRNQKRKSHNFPSGKLWSVYKPLIDNIDPVENFQLEDHVRDNKPTADNSYQYSVSNSQYSSTKVVENGTRVCKVNE